MCGLVGIAGEALYSAEIEMFRTMLLLDYLRGEHSTGVLTRVANKKSHASSISILKAEGHPVNLFNRYPRHFEPETGNVIVDNANDSLTLLLGHNRYATIGGKTMNNAHPFNQDHIFGAHNGTVKTGHYTLLSDEQKKKLKGETDSEKIYTAMAGGMTLEEMEQKLVGAWALTWWNGEERTVNLYRNAERSLFYAYNETLKRLTWASEKWMIELAARKAVKEKTGEIHSLPEHHHLKLQFNEENKVTGFSVTKVEIKKPVHAVVTAPAAQRNEIAPPVKGNYMAGARQPDYLRSSTASNYAKLEPYDIEGWLHFKNTNCEAYEELIKDGCATCSTKLSKDEKVFFLDPRLPLCETCSADWKKAA